MFLANGELSLIECSFAGNVVQGGLAITNAVFPYPGAANGSGIGPDVFHLSGAIVVSNSTMPGLAGLPPATDAQTTTNLIAFRGTDLTLSITVTGAGPTSVQWQKDGAAIPHATNATFVVADVQAVDSGTYVANVTSPYGAANSTPITVTVLGPPRLTAISVAPNTLSLSWPTVPGRIYRVEYKDDLDTGPWQPLAPDRVVWGASLTITDPIGVQRQRFYRVTHY